VAIFEGSFKSKAIKNFYYNGTTKGLPVKNTDKLQDILDYIDTISTLPPSPMLFRVHEHKGKGLGTWSFDITGNMRVLCEFDEDMDAINIRIEDPH
jgi:plasmid maintenance system killer protein